MLTLLHLLSSVALLVWGTHIVRTGIMRVYGANLRRVLSDSVEKKPLAFVSGIGVTALVQSSNATALLVTSFVAQGLVGLAPALVIMLGADVGTALMARVLTFDLSWLSPLLILIGVFLFLSRKQMRIGQIGRVLIGLGLIVLALELIVAAATPITQAAGVKVLFSSLTGDVMLDALTGALFAIVSYSSLAAVLLTATLTASGVISLKVALCLVMIPLAGPMATLCERLIVDVAADDPRMRPRHLDASALDTPTLALANAARETLRMGDVVEHMMILQREVLHGKQGVDKEVRRLDDDVDVLYTAIKLYLAQIQKEDLGEEDSRRWAEIIEMALNLEQAGDIIERMAGDVGAKSHAARRAFSTEGLAELDGLHERLIGNLRLGLSVFLSGDVTSAKRLRRSKHRFRILDRRYAHAHVDRLHQQNVQSIETSSLHLGLLGDMKRLNSLFCAVAYNVLDQDAKDDDRDWEDTPSTL
ncbi:Na/Pi cotransporter family protein [Serratia nevei]|uniref:Na/Pi cotransporter family protein n=1 Tax=Serratia nevei TaxID=2703794 RepID=UPI0040679793